ncbi:MAG: hypothetical protein WDM80_10290 [Limisphaerales bacterium]
MPVLFALASFMFTEMKMLMQVKSKPIFSSLTLAFDLAAIAEMTFTCHRSLLNL